MTLREALRDFDVLYADVRQLHQGFIDNNPSENWSAWDKSVADRFMQFGRAVLDALAAPDESASSDELICPFCGDRGFDAIGLKTHLLRNGWCEAFDRVICY